MSIHDDVIRSIEKMPDGPEIGAFFDFDGTLIAGYSAAAFIQEQLKQGHVTAREFLELVAVMTNFGLGKLGFSGLMVANAQTLRGVTEDSYVAFGEEIYAKHIARKVYPESRALVEAHQRKGHTVAIISSATPYQIVPAARDLDIDNVLCTRLEVKDGVFTGGVLRPTCWGQGKVLAAEQLAEKFDLDLDSSFFYSDSHEDLALLERVGFPQPLNPNEKLQEIATRRGWPVRRFDSRGTPSAGEVLRSILASLSLITSFVAGLPVWALTGSKREAQNFSFSLFADSTAALIGLDLKVTGERHLWSHRPAVFVFNHQSKADMVVIAKLLRRDVAGVGKKEIGDIPILGKIMEYGGTVLIDRKNASSAIAAMAPLVDAMKNDGKSVVLAPEGTRTLTPKLAPFKKGAFHLAIQAGVPMVPIVIHNAIDVSPKGDFVFRAATVEVEVLPPIDTSEWSAKTISDHVAEVRQMYLDALEQEPGGDRPQSIEVPALAPEVAAAKARKKSAAKTKPNPATKAASGKKAAAKTKPKSATKTVSRKKAAAKTKPKPATKTASGKKAAAKTKPKPATKAASRKTTAKSASKKAAAKATAKAKSSNSGQKASSVRAPKPTKPKAKKKAPARKTTRAAASKKSGKPVTRAKKTNGSAANGKSSAAENNQRRRPRRRAGTIARLAGGAKPPRKRSASRRKLAEG